MSEASEVLKQRIGDVAAGGWEKANDLQVIMNAQLDILERLDELVAVRAINQSQQLILDRQNKINERLDQFEAKMPPDLDGDGYAQ